MDEAPGRHLSHELAPSDQHLLAVPLPLCHSATRVGNTIFYEEPVADYMTQHAVHCIRVDVVIDPSQKIKPFSCEHDAKWMPPPRRSATHLFNYDQKIVRGAKGIS